MNRYSPLRDSADGKVVCAFSPRSLHNMSLYYGDTKESLGNRKDFLTSLGIDYSALVCAKQVHADNVRYVKEADSGKGALFYENSIPDTDALITDKRNLPLAIFTADCLSIFLFDPRTPAIGLIHAGWRSSRERIAVKTLALMQEEFSSRAQDLLVGFGPSIRSCCYQVGSELQDYFSDGIIKKEDSYYLDLISINKKQLLASGVKEKNIFDAQICTFCQAQEFFSYRKEGKSCGRSMSVIMLK